METGKKGSGTVVVAVVVVDDEVETKNDHFRSWVRIEGFDVLGERLTEELVYMCFSRRCTR